MASQNVGEQLGASRDEVKDASDGANRNAEPVPSTSEQGPSVTNVDEPASASSSYVLSGTGIIQETFDLLPRGRRASSSATSSTTIIGAGQLTPTSDTRSEGFNPVADPRPPTSDAHPEGSNIDAQHNEDQDALYLPVPANETDAMLQLVQQTFSSLAAADRADPEARAQIRRRLAREWVDNNDLFLSMNSEDGDNRTPDAPRGPLAILDAVGSVLERQRPAAVVVPSADNASDQQATRRTEAIPATEDRPDQQATSTSAPKNAGGKKKKRKQRSESAKKERRKKQEARRKAKREAKREVEGPSKADEDDDSAHAESGHKDALAAQCLPQERENDVCVDMVKKRTRLIIPQAADERSGSQTTGLAGAEVRDSIEDPETPKNMADVGSSRSPADPDVSGSPAGRGSSETAPGPGTSENKSSSNHGEDDEGKSADLVSSADGEAQITLEHPLPDAMNSTGFHHEPSPATPALEQDGKTEGCSDAVLHGNSRSQSPQTRQRSGSVNIRENSENTPHPTSSAPQSHLSNLSTPPLPVIKEEPDGEMAGRPAADKSQGGKKNNRRSRTKKQMGTSKAGEGSAAVDRQSSGHGEQAKIGAPDKNERPPIDRTHEAEQAPAVESDNKKGVKQPMEPTDKHEDSAASIGQDERAVNVRKSRSDSIKFLRARTFSRSSAIERSELLPPGPDLASASASASASAALSSETAVDERDSGDSGFPVRAAAEEVSRPATAASQETVSERTIGTRTSGSSTRLNPEASAFQPGAGVFLGAGMPMPDPMGLYAAAGPHPSAGLPPPGHGGHYVPPIALTDADMLRYIAADEEYQRWKVTDARIPPPDVQAAFDRREAEQQARLDNTENQPPLGSGAENTGSSEHQGSQDGSSTSVTQTHAGDDSAARSVLTDRVNIEHAHVESAQQNTPEAVRQADCQVQGDSASETTTSAQPQSEVSELPERSIVAAYVLPQTSRLRDEVLGPDMGGPAAHQSRASRSDTVVRHDPSDQPRQRAVSQADPTVGGDNRVDGGSQPASQSSSSNTGSITRTGSGPSSGRGRGGHASLGQHGRGRGSHRGHGRQQQGRQQHDRNQRGGNQRDRNQQDRHQQSRQQQAPIARGSTSQGSTPQVPAPESSTSQAAIQEAPTRRPVIVDGSNQRFLAPKGPTMQAQAQESPTQQAAIAQGSTPQVPAPESSTSQALIQEAPTRRPVIVDGSNQRFLAPKGPTMQAQAQESPTQQAAIAQGSDQQVPAPESSTSQAAIQEAPTRRPVIVDGSNQRFLTPKGPTMQAQAQESPTPQTAIAQASTQQAPAPEGSTSQAAIAQGSTLQVPAPGGSTTQASAQEAPVQEAPAQEAPAQEAPAQEAPAQEAPAQEAPAQEAPAQEAPAQQGRKRAATYAATQPSSSSPPQVPKVHSFKELLFKCTWCGIPLSDRTPTTLLCNGCGPFSPTRYCSHEHMMSGLYLHEGICGRQSLNILVDINTLPERYSKSHPAIWNIYGHRGRALLRQRHFSTHRHDQCDYAIFKDVQAKEEAGCYVFTMVPYVTIRLNDSELKDIINRLLNLAFLNHALVRPLLLLYRLLRQCLRSGNSWNDRVKSELDRQFVEEFLIDPNHMVHPSNPDMDAEWYGEGGVEKIVNDHEERYGVLRLWRREHPDPVIRADGWTRYYGFQWPNARVPRDYGLGPGWDGPLRGMEQTEAQAKAEAMNDAENLARAQEEISALTPLQSLGQNSDNLYL